MVKLENNWHVIPKLSCKMFSSCMFIEMFIKHVKLCQVLSHLGHSCK